MRQQTVGKGQHGVYPIQRRAAAAPVEEESLLSTQEHVIEDAEIRGGGSTLYSPQGVQVSGSQHLRQHGPDVGGGVFQTAARHAGRVIPQGTLDAGGAVAQLAEDHGAGYRTTAGGVIGSTVLFTPEQHVAAALAAGAGEETPMRGAEGQTDPGLRAFSHQRGGGTGIGETDDGLQRVQRIAGDDGLVSVCQHVFPLQREVDVLRGDK